MVLACPWRGQITPRAGTHRVKDSLPRDRKGTIAPDVALSCRIKGRRDSLDLQCETRKPLYYRLDGSLLTLPPTSANSTTDTDLLIEGSSVLSIRPPRTLTCSSKVRPSFRSGRHGYRPAHQGGGRHGIRRGHRPAHRRFVRPFSQAATDTDLLIKVAVVVRSNGPQDHPQAVPL